MVRAASAVDIDVMVVTHEQRLRTGEQGAQNG